MGLTDALYASVDDLKGYLRIDDTDDDAELALAVEAASRAIHPGTNRHFGLDDPAVTRRYTWDGQLFASALAVLTVDDISETAALVVDNDGEIIDSDGFQLYPTNAAIEGRPFTTIVLKDGRWSREPQGIAITAKFGWAAVPDVVKQATLLQASRFYQRRESPYGIAGSPDVGSEMRLLARLDPDVAVMLGTVTRWWGAV